MGPGEYLLLFSTICEILNRRPISSYVQDDEIHIISPNHLMMGRHTKCVPMYTMPENTNMRVRMKLVSDLTSQFWNRLMEELCRSSAFRASKWTQRKRVPQIKDIILILYKSKVQDDYR